METNLTEQPLIDSPQRKAERRRTNKVIKFMKDNSVNDDKDALEVDLNKAIELDEPYGRADLKESKEVVDKKKNHVLKDDYFSSTINQEKIINTILPEYISINETDLDEYIQELFTGLNKSELSTFERIKKEFKGKQISANCTNVGPLVPSKCIDCVMNVHSDISDKLFEEISRDISKARFILNDGDSFYRAFMFALIEHYILYKNIYELKKLIYAVSKKLRSKIFKRKNAETNLNEILWIFYLLYSNLQEGNIQNAYSIFFTAININKNFDIGLIKFMKIAMAEYIEDNASLIFKDEHFEEIEAIAAPAYLNNHVFDFRKYIEDRILTMNYDADKFIVQLSPTVFHMNLDLYCIEGTAEEVKHISYLKNYFTCLSDKSLHKSISLFYHFSRYDKLYSNDLFNSFQNDLYFSLGEEEFTAKCSQRYIEVNKMVACDICKQRSDEICFEHIPNFNFCKICIIEAVDKIITHRINHFISEYYNNASYYCRPVSLSKSNPQYKLYDEDFVALFGRNVAQTLLYTMDALCFNCMQKLTDDSIKMPECECKLCKRCATNFIMEATDHKIILNNYEKKKTKAKKVICSCGEPFDTETAIDLIYKNKINDYRSQAQQRLMDVASETCCICNKIHKKNTGSKIVSMNTNTRDNNVYFKFDIIPESGVDTGDCTHIMCKKCLDVLNSELDKMIKKGEMKQNDLFMLLDCKVFYKRHKVESKKFRSAASRNNQDNSCCVVF